MMPAWPLGNPVVLVVTFSILLGGFLWHFSGGRPGSLVHGLVRLAGALFRAPLRYLHLSAARILDYAGTSHGRDVSDKQYLVGTILMITNAVIFLAAVGILASTVTATWYALYPPSIGIRRAAMEVRAKELESRIPSIRRDLEDVTTKLGTETATELNVRELRKTGEDLRAALQRDGQALDQRNPQEWQNLKTYLARLDNRLLQEFEVRNAESQVRPFLTRIRDSALSQALTAYFDAWVNLRNTERNLAQQERINPRVALQQQKGNLERSLTQAESEAVRIREKLGLRGLFDELQFAAALLALLWGMLSCLLWVWVLGLAVEAAELAVDIAANVRAARKSLERAPAGGDV